MQRNELYFHDHVEAAPSLLVGQLVDGEVRRISYFRPREEDASFGSASEVGN